MGEANVSRNGYFAEPPHETELKLLCTSTRAQEQILARFGEYIRHWSNVSVNRSEEIRKGEVDAQSSVYAAAMVHIRMVTAQELRLRFEHERAFSQPETHDDQVKRGQRIPFFSA